MSDSKPEASWTEANQAYLVAEFGRVKARLRPGSPATGQEVTQTAIEPPAAIDRLAEIFGLSISSGKYCCFVPGPRWTPNWHPSAAQPKGSLTRLPPHSD